MADTLEVLQSSDRFGVDRPLDPGTERWSVFGNAFRRRAGAHARAPLAHARAREYGSVVRYLRDHAG